MDFECFWGAYPRRLAKKDARKAWEKLTAQQQEAAMKSLPSHIEHWSDREMKYVPYPASWLNGERWEDELDVKGPDVAALMRQLEMEGR
jgi:hypothetical protein